jgi:hypothetical protein
MRCPRRSFGLAISFSYLFINEAVVSNLTILAIEATLNDSALSLAFLRNVEGSLGFVVYETSMEELISTMPFIII